MIATKSTTLSAALEEAERESQRLKETLKEAGDRVVITLHPGALEAYRRRISDLEEVLADDDDRRDELAGVIRPLLAGVRVKSNASDDGWEIELDGQLAAMMAVSNKEPLDVSVEGSLHCTAMVGAGVGFEPTTFRL